jgi:hypothetical protein
MSINNRRIVEIYLDVTNSRQSDSTGKAIVPGEVLTLYRKSETLLQVHLKLDGTNYYSPPAGGSWLFGIDNSFADGHSDLVVTDDADFNQADDWASLDETGGKICFPVDTATTALATEMAATGRKEMTAELWFTPAGQNTTLICQWKVVIKNIVVETGASSSDLVYTTTEFLQRDGDDIVLLYEDGSVAQRWSRT